MSKEEVRLTVAKMLDGMKFNKDKFARDCLSLCDLVARLEDLVKFERKTREALAEQLLKEQELRSKQSSGPFDNDMPDGFKDIFDTFAKTQGHMHKS